MTLLSLLDSVAELEASPLGLDALDPSILQ